MKLGEKPFYLGISWINFSKNGFEMRKSIFLKLYLVITYISLDETLQIQQ